jgi:hypothetical protein
LKRRRYRSQNFQTASSGKKHLLPGLPDGIFSCQKSKFWVFLEGYGMENVGVFYGLLEYVMAHWHNLWPFDIVYGHFVYFVVIWYILPVCCSKKNLATLFASPKTSSNSQKIAVEKFSPVLL